MQVRAFERYIPLRRFIENVELAWGQRTTKAQTSLCTGTLWSALWLYAFWKVSCLHLLQQNLNVLANLCSGGDWFESGFVRNPQYPDFSPWGPCYLLPVRKSIYVHLKWAFIFLVTICKYYLKDVSSKMLNSLGGWRTTTVQTSLCTNAVWSALWLYAFFLESIMSTLFTTVTAF